MVSNSGDDRGGAVPTVAMQAHGSGPVRTHGSSPAPMPGSSLGLSPGPAPPTQRPRLVVVDDEVDMLDFVERTFRRECQVERARSVEEALPLLQTGTVRVLITDRRMPRRSGAELLERARALQPAAVRILLTGFSDGSEADPGTDALLHKPIDAEALRAAVSEALVRRALED